eukprot:gene4995-15241_t
MRREHKGRPKDDHWRIAALLQDGWTEKEIREEVKCGGKIISKVKEDMSKHHQPAPTKKKTKRLRMRPIRTKPVVNKVDELLKAGD